MLHLVHFLNVGFFVLFLIKEPALFKQFESFKYSLANSVFDPGTMMGPKGNEMGTIGPTLQWLITAQW